MLCLSVLGFALLSLVAGQSSDGGSDSVYGGQHYGYLPASVLVDPLLNRLNRYVDNLEAREVAQLSRVGRLTALANQNRDFQNLFENSQEIADRQKTQEQRLDELAKAVEALKAWRQNVELLSNDATNLGSLLQDQIYPARKQVMYDISDLQNADIERMNLIEASQTRANAVNDRIDVEFDKANVNTRDLNSVKLSVRRSIASVSRQEFSQSDLSPEPNTSQNVSFSFDGAPQFSQVVLNGFELIKTYSGYPTGYPNIYFGLDSVLMNTMAQVDAVDKCNGGWFVESINIGADFLYFDTLQNSILNN